MQKGPLTAETKFGLSSCSLTVFDLIYTWFFFNGEGKSCMTSRVYFSVKEMEKLKEGLKRSECDSNLTVIKQVIP